MNVFIQKDGKMVEVQVVERIEGGRERFWFEGKKDQPQQPKEAEEPSTRDEGVTVLEEDTPEEIEVMNKMWLMDKVASLEMENEEMKKAHQEMATRVQLQENMLRRYVELQGVFHSAVTRICESVQRQNAFTKSASAAINGLAGEAQKHQDTFREVGRILLNHEEHIAQTGVASQEMAQCINALIQDSEKKTVWISSLMRDSQEKTHVLRQHQLGLQVQAEVIKRLANQQQQQPQQ